jgi:hypothetical protein
MNPAGVQPASAPARCRNCGRSISTLCSAAENFWNRPGNWVDREWLPGWYTDFEQASGFGIYAMRRLRSQLYNHIGLSPEELTMDFSHSASRFLLLGSKAVKNAVNLAGAALYSKTISSIVAGTEIRVMVKEIGEETWRFAISRASLLGNTDSIKSIIRKEDGTWQARITGAGLQIAAAAASCAGPGAYKLLRRFFPGDVLYPSCAACPQEIRTQAWELIRKIVVQEISPQWKPLLS